MPEVIRAVCPHDCPDTCSMLARVEMLPDGTQRLLSVAGNPANPYTAGSLCRKVAHYEDRVYSPDRLLHPTGEIGESREEEVPEVVPGEISSALEPVLEELRHQRLASTGLYASLACVRKGRQPGWEFGRSRGAFVDA